MQIVEFLQDLSFKGVKLQPNGETLRIAGFQSMLTPEVVAQLKQHKPEILQTLQDCPDILNVYPLSYGQQAMWFLWQLAPEQAIYNVALTCRICCSINVAILRETFQTLMERHPMLASTFPKQGNKPVQVLHQAQFADFQQIDASPWSEGELDQRVFQEYLQPFDIENGPVMRVRLFTCSQQNHVLLLTAHHIAIDAWCLPLLMEEMILIYPELASGKQPTLIPLKHSYIDYVRWQKELLASPQGEELWSYWQKKLAGNLPVLNLPTDRPRPPIQTYNGASHYFALSPKLTEQLQELAQVQDATVYMVLLAAFQILLYRYTGQEDILVGVPTAGRSKPEFVPLVGYFVDPVVMRGNLAGDPSFQQFLVQVRTCVLEALTYQDFPFALLVERLQPQRDPSCSPIFQVTFNFVLQNLGQYPYAQQLLLGGEVDRQGFKVKPYPMSQMEGQFDLDLIMAEQDSFLSGYFKYNTDLFDPEAIAQIMSHFQTLLASIVSNPQQNISQLSLFSEAERELARRVEISSSSEVAIYRLQSEKSLETVVGSAIYIQDAYGEEVPRGVEGEICIREPFEKAVANGQEPYRRTGKWGRQRRDGVIEILGLKRRQVWVQGCRINLQKIEQTLFAIASIDDCYVLPREGELIAYIVSRESPSSESLNLHLQTHLPELMLPVTFVPVSTLPLKTDGEIDEGLLKSLEVIDAQLLEQWQDQLNRVPEIQQAVVIANTHYSSPSLLHLSKVLPPKTSYTAIPLPVGEKVAVGDFIFNPEATALTLPAISDGGVLHIPEDAPKTLTAALIQTATRCPNQGMTYIDSEGKTEFQTYRMLLNEAQCILSGLRHQGLRPGDRVILQIASLQDYFPTLWGCILGGIQPVTVTVAPTYQEKNAVLHKLYNTWKLLDNPYILASDSLVANLGNVRSLLPLLTLKVFAISELKTHSPTSDFYFPHPKEVAFLQLTSGSTGIPKCIQETHEGIITHIHAAQQFNEYTTADICLNWLPVDHVVPILTCHFKDTYLGCQQIEVETSVILTNPLKWLDLMEQYRVSHSWSPNFGFKLVSEALTKTLHKNWDLSCIKFLMNAGEQVTPKVVREFLDLMAPFGLSSQVMQPAFGMAEVCTCMTYQNQFDQNTAIHRIKKSSLGSQLKLTTDEGEAIELTDLGPPIPGVQIRIVNSQNRLLPEGVIGRFQIRGKVVTPGYLNNDKANAEAFVGDGWFNSGDLGFLFKGHLILTGREKETIIINGVNYYCYEIEDVVNNIPGVTPTYTGACAFTNLESGTERLVIFFVPKETKSQLNIQLIQNIIKEVTLHMGITPLYVIPLERQEFPKTTSGKIQRSQLKQKLESGELSSLIQEIETRLGKNIIPDWFYHKVWLQKKASINCSSINCSSITSKVVLVFVDSLGLGARVIAELKAREHTVIQVEIGDQFTKITPSHYLLNPRQESDYQQLIKVLNTNNYTITHIFHLWNYELTHERVSSLEALERSQDKGLYSLLFLAKALLKTKNTIQLFFVSNFCQSVLPNDAIVPEKTTALGFLKTIPQEIPNLHCRHIDLPVAAIEINSAHLLEEFRALAIDSEVAYRDEKRFVPRLQKTDFEPKQCQELPFKMGGVYLIIGGLGGIGSKLARYLLEHYQARLLLIGRTPLPDESLWEAVQKASLRNKIQIYRQLRQLPGEVFYQAVDVCNLTEMKQVLDSTLSHWQLPLNGVIHLAGELQEKLIASTSKETLAAGLQQKVRGTWILHRLLQNHQLDLWVHFSSVNSFFGGTGVGAYAAANRFLEAVSADQTASSSWKSYCLHWSMWDEIGMSRGYPLKDLSREKGFSTISATQGLDSFLVALAYRQTNLLIGLDASKRAIQGFIKGCQSTQQLTAFVTANTSELSVESLQIRDRFGTPTECRVVQLDTMPLTDGGAIDLKQFTSSIAAVKTGKEAAPRNDVERQIQEIFQNVLGLEQVGIRDNFFALGGHSILAAQVISQMRQTFARELPLWLLFQSPTIEDLAKGLITPEQVSAKVATGLTGVAGPLPAHPCLVPIKPQGTKSPFFWIHPMAGVIFPYYPMAYLLGADQPVYGLQSVGLQGEKPPLKRIEEMAADYIAAMRFVQPQGPYYLGGWSLGAYGAYEMAVQLQQANQEVALVALLDTPCSLVGNYSPQDVWKLSRELLKIMQEVWPYVYDYLALATASQPSSYNIKNLIKYLLSSLGYHSEMSQVMTQYPQLMAGDQQPPLTRLVKVLFANTQAILRYKSPAYDGKVMLLKTHNLLSTSDETWGWGKVAKGGVAVYSVPGNHMNLLRQPHVQVIADILTECLAAVDSEKSS